jgi:DNA-binding NarL/FixJ family response regulator
VIRVLVADDHPVVRQGIRQILADASDIVIGAEAVTGEEVMTRLRSGSWDLLLLDITMPGVQGLELLTRCRAERPELPVLILTMHAEEQFAVRALKGGAAGYLTKDAMPGELVRAIRKAATGGKYVGARLAEQLAERLHSGGTELPHDRLSDREYQVMCLLARGKSVGEIAGELEVSVKTVSTFRARILEKLEMRTNADVIRYALRNRLVD